MTPAAIGALWGVGLRRFSTRGTRRGFASVAGAAETGNPLLTSDVLPHFDAIKAEHVEPAIKEILATAEKGLAEIEEVAGELGYEELSGRLERLADQLERSWGAIGHLKMVKDHQPLREAYEKMQPEVVMFTLRLGQSRALYDSIQLFGIPGSYAVSWPTRSLAPLGVQSRVLRPTSNPIFRTHPAF